jgi:hypothetical protein
MIFFISPYSEAAFDYLGSSIYIFCKDKNRYQIALPFMSLVYGIPDTRNIFFEYADYVVITLDPSKISSPVKVVKNKEIII